MPNSICGPWLADELVFGANSGEARRGAESKAADPEAARRRHHTRQAWHAWGVCWALLNEPLVYTDDCKNEDVREERAALFKVSVDAFVRAHVAAAGTTEGLYMHILHAHVPDQIRRWGDLRPRQTQGLEHAHKIRKQVGLNASNRKQGQRILTMLRHKSLWAAILRAEKEDYHVVVAAAKKRALMLRVHRKISKNAVFDQSELLLCDPLTILV